MSRKEFLGQLERLLWDIPEQEREEALEYYQSYFDDAGEENESSVIQELGSPGKVAAIIKADLVENREEYGEYTESGYADERFDDRDMPDKLNSSRERSGENNWDGTRYRGPETEQKRDYDGPYRRAGWEQNAYTVKKQRSGISWALIIILIILGFPIWGGIVLGLFGALLGIIAGIFGIMAGLLFGGIGLVVGGVAALVQALIFQMASPATAIAAAGIALLIIAAGLLLVTAAIWLTFRVFPVCFRWFIDLIQRILHRSRVGGDAG